MHLLAIVALVAFVLIIIAIIICFLKKDLFENYTKILKAPECTHAGLGDRIGEYIIFSTLGKIHKCNVLVYWCKRNKNWASRGNEYPDDIHDYIKFPENLKFVKEKEWKSNKAKEICPKRWNWNNYYFGDELVPEIAYKKLNLDKYLSLEDYLKLYKDTAKQISYKKELPILPTNFTAVHIRRGDKSSNTKKTEYHNNRLNNVFNKLNIQNYILCSEDGNEITSKEPTLIKVSNDNKIRTLEEFFVLSKANKIIQSIPGDNKYGGWTSYSYVASRIGDSILYNCSPEGTRIYYMEGIIGKKLYNVVKYSDLFISN